MTLSSSTNNCGMTHLIGLSIDPKVTLLAFGADWQMNGKELIVFSDAVHTGNCKNLSDFIIEHKLGELVESKHTNNIVHNWPIHAFFWSINRENFLTWYEANKPKEKPRVVEGTVYVDHAQSVRPLTTNGLLDARNVVMKNHIERCWVQWKYYRTTTGRLR